MKRRYQETIEVSGSASITHNEVTHARKNGYLLHHEYQSNTQYYYDEAGDECSYENVTRNEWFAASREFVSDYHADGGVWGYND